VWGWSDIESCSLPRFDAAAALGFQVLSLQPSKDKMYLFVNINRPAGQFGCESAKSNLREFFIFLSTLRLAHRLVVGAAVGKRNGRIRPAISFVLEKNSALT
jgi:hypothetical protein